LIRGFIFVINRKLLSLRSYKLIKRSYLYEAVVKTEVYLDVVRPRVYLR
jgi:hypothetical protein